MSGELHQQLLPQLFQYHCYANYSCYLYCIMGNVSTAATPNCTRWIILTLQEDCDNTCGQVQVEPLLHHKRPLQQPPRQKLWVVDGWETGWGERHHKRLCEDAQHQEGDGHGAWAVHHPLTWEEHLSTGGGNMGGRPCPLHSQGVQPRRSWPWVSHIWEEGRWEGGRAWRLAGGSKATQTGPH